MFATSSAVSENATRYTTQQSNTSVDAQKRMTSTTLRDGANREYKRPKQKKAKTTDFGVMFGPSGSVVEMVSFLLYKHI